jgi:hypothetical protein
VVCGILTEGNFCVDEGEVKILGVKNIEIIKVKYTKILENEFFISLG